MRFQGRMHLTLAVWGALLVSQDDLFGQGKVDSLPKGQPGIVPGARVRITAIESGNTRRYAGSIVSATADTVVLRLDPNGRKAGGSLVPVSLVEFGQGRKGQIGTGVGLGFLIGASVGAAIGATLPEAGESGAVLILGGIGSGIGILAGGGIGSLVKAEKWKPVDTPGSLTWVTFAALREGQTPPTSAAIAPGFVLLGIGAGAAAGVAIAGLADNPPLPATVIGGGVGAVVSLLVGREIGHTRKAQTPKPLPSSRWRVSGGPGRGGVVVWLSNRF